MPLAKAMQLIKGGSSKWMNDTGANSFAWQEGYGAFSVGVSQQADTISYICSQAEHHRKRGFEEEFLAFLKKHRIEYDLSHVWGYFQSPCRGSGLPTSDPSDSSRTQPSFLAEHEMALLELRGLAPLPHPCAPHLR